MTTKKKCSKRQCVTIINFAKVQRNLYICKLHTINNNIMSFVNHVMFGSEYLFLQQNYLMHPVTNPVNRTNESLKKLVRVPGDGFQAAPLPQGCRRREEVTGRATNQHLYCLLVLGSQRLARNTHVFSSFVTWVLVHTVA